MIEQPTCLCCGVPLDALRAPPKLCGKAACAWKHQITPPGQRCKICQRILTIGQFARRLCASESCRRAWAEVQHGEQERLQQEQRERLEAQVAHWRDEFAAEVPNASLYPVALVPYNPAAPIALPASRREALRAHLIDIAAQAIAAKASRSEIAESETSASATPTDDVLLHACSACRGSCCRNGGERAYLTSDTIARYLDQFPDSSVEEIADAYLSYLADETMAGGCVYQHATGCTLPRSLRSDTCNNYLCADLHSFQHRHRDDEPLRAFFVATDRGDIAQGVFVSREVVQLVRQGNADTSNENT